MQAALTIAFPPIFPTTITNTSCDTWLDCRPFDEAWK